MMVSRALQVGARHWFYLVVPLLIPLAFALRGVLPWRSEPGMYEAVTLIDWCVVVPLLFALCYRRMPLKALALRTLAVACGGLWLAGQIVPGPAQSLLGEWGWVRGIGLAVLFAFEAVAIVAVLRIAFGATPDVAELERQGVPPPIARAMLAEARFWRWVWARLSGGRDGRQ